MSSKDNAKEHVMHSKINNREIIINDKADEVIEEHFPLISLDIKLGWKHQ